MQDNVNDSKIENKKQIANLLECIKKKFTNEYDVMMKDTGNQIVYTKYCTRIYINPELEDNTTDKVSKIKALYEYEKLDNIILLIVTNRKKEINLNESTYSTGSNDEDDEDDEDHDLDTLADLREILKKQSEKYKEFTNCQIVFDLNQKHDFDELNKIIEKLLFPEDKKSIILNKMILMLIVNGFCREKHEENKTNVETRFFKHPTLGKLTIIDNDVEIDDSDSYQSYFNIFTYLKDIDIERLFYNIRQRKDFLQKITKAIAFINEHNNVLKLQEIILDEYSKLFYNDERGILFILSIDPSYQNLITNVSNPKIKIYDFPDCNSQEEYWKYSYVRNKLENLNKMEYLNDQLERIKLENYSKMLFDNKADFTIKYEEIMFFSTDESKSITQKDEHVSPYLLAKCLSIEQNSTSKSFSLQPEAIIYYDGSVDNEGFLCETKRYDYKENYIDEFKGDIKKIFLSNNLSPNTNSLNLDNTTQLTLKRKLP